MTIQIRTEKEISIMKEGGKILSETLKLVIQNAKPGISTKQLDDIAEKYIISKGAKPGFKGYQGFPATLCVAINNAVVHGIPNKNEYLKEGDLFTIDCGVLYKGLYTDAARSIGIGKIDKEKENLIKVAKEALKAGIGIVKPGVKVNEIGRAIQNIVEKNNYKIIYDLTGHGVGKNLHESPTIFNYYHKKASQILKEGMTLAIEPIFSVSTNYFIEAKDGWTLITKDGSIAIQEEETILVTKNGSEIISKS